MPVLLVALACGATLAASRRRAQVASDLPEHALPPASLPSVDRFEMIATGGSALLRVHAQPAADPARAVLVLDRGDEMDLVSALPSTMAGGAIGFACERALLDGVVSFWLQLDGGTLALGEPSARAF